MLLASGSSGTTPGPELPPFSAPSYVLRSSPPNPDGLPWHAVHFVLNRSPRPPAQVTAPPSGSPRSAGGVGGGRVGSGVGVSGANTVTCSGGGAGTVSIAVFSNVTKTKIPT